jgi:RND superfamily putative drug exporter
MAKFLFNLGAFSARRAWLVLSAWLIILATSVALAGISGGSFTTTMSVPGTPAQKTIDQLKANFSDASRGSGQVVLATHDGKEFTVSEKAAINKVLTELESLPRVDDVLNPFKTQKQLDDARAELADGQTKLDDAPAEFAKQQKKIDDGIAALDAAQAKLDAGLIDAAKGQKELDAQTKKLNDGLKQIAGGIAQATAAGAPQAQIEALKSQQAQLLAAKPQLAAGQKKIDEGLSQAKAGQIEIDANRKKLADGQVKLDEAKADLPANAAKLANGQKLLAASANFRTISADGATAVATVFFDAPLNQITAEQKHALVDALTNADIKGVDIEVSQDLSQTAPSIFGIGELIGVLIAAVVLFLMLGTLVGAGLPLIAAIIGVGIAATATTAIASLVEMTSTTLSLAGMLGLAVGIDYALFIINRHRRQLKAGMQVRESIALANGTSGSAVLFAGLTVVIALAALNLTGIGFLGLMGTVGAAAIALAVIVAVTFTPAFLSLLGMKILSKRERKALALFDDEHPNSPERISVAPVFANKHPWITVLATTVVLAVMAIPFSSMRLGLPDGASENTHSTQYKAYKAIAEGFGVGMNGPLAAVVTLNDAELGAKSSEAEKVEFQADVATRLMALDNVDAVIFGGESADERTLLFQVLPTTGPTSVETENLVQAIRAQDAVFESELDADLQVTGLSAANIDISQRLADSLPLYLSTVLILSLLLLMVVFRSIAVPLVASVGFLLSVFAALGSVTAVFQWGWLGAIFDVHDPGPILAFLPTLVIGILFGLAMDYQLFLVSGMREAYVHGKNAKDSVNYGIHLSRQVVVAAAIIMISVFGSFAFSEQVMLRAVGFGLAIGVLLDAFLVRLLFVPAVMSLLGDRAWWLPRWLDRIMPNVDVEGEKLERTVAH